MTTPMSAERERMGAWFDTVSYVEQYLDELPDVTDDPDGDDGPVSGGDA